MDQGEDVHALLVGLVDQAVAAYHEFANLGIIELLDDAALSVSSSSDLARSRMRRTIAAA